MNYWWVNQGSTHEEEHQGGYMWSPTREINGARNQAYENMKLVAPGDRIFSHYNGRVSAIGTALSYCYASPRPDEFPKDQNKGNIEGWRVDVSYRPCAKHLNPQASLTELLPLLPSRYSPLDKNGRATQKLYLVHLPAVLSAKMLELLEISSGDFPPVENIDMQVERDVSSRLDERLLRAVMADSFLTETEKNAVIAARRGQGLFRRRVAEFESKCRISGISNPSFLIAGHIKPWRESTNLERLDGENGLLFSPNIDRLFDRNFISFSDSGELLISPLLSAEERIQFGLNKNANLGAFTPGQRRYLAHHRARLKASRG